MLKIKKYWVHASRLIRSLKTNGKGRILLIEGFVIFLRQNCGPIVQGIE